MLFGPARFMCNVALGVARSRTKCCFSALPQLIDSRIRAGAISRRSKPFLLVLAPVFGLILVMPVGIVPASRAFHLIDGQPEREHVFLVGLLAQNCNPICEGCFGNARKECDGTIQTSARHPHLPARKQRSLPQHNPGQTLCTPFALGQNRLDVSAFRYRLGRRARQSPRLRSARRSRSRRPRRS